ncbi:MAG: hypothetical protein ACOYES_04000 [Bacillota bacterium]|jgi:hypothetical protein
MTTRVRAPARVRVRGAGQDPGRTTSVHRSRLSPAAYMAPAVGVLRRLAALFSAGASAPRDYVEIGVAGQTMIVERVMPAAAVAHELSVVLPHVEVRRTRDPSRPEVIQEEVVVESITVVSSPVRRMADDAGRGILGRRSKAAK